MADLSDGCMLALLLCAALALVNLASIGLGASRLGRRPRGGSFPDGAPVSLIRPVCGLEPFSEETLRSGFDLAYRDYELVFCVADRHDPVVPLIERLMREHPERPARLLFGDVRISDNPKLNNCVKGWDAARHEWVVLADSNVLMPADYLQRLQSAWTEEAGLVCSTPIGARPLTFAAEVECAFLNTLQARWQYAAAALGLGFAQGKSMLWHKPFLEARGGIRALAAETAEDAAATKLVRAAGRQVHLVPLPFEQPLGLRSLSEVWARQLRWARLRRVTFPLFFAPEIGIAPLLPFAIAAVLTQDAIVLGALIVTTLAWYGAELALARRAGWHRSWRTLPAFLVRDALLPLIWLAAWAQSAIVWRGNAMDIRTRDTKVLRPGAA